MLVTRQGISSTIIGSGILISKKRIRYVFGMGRSMVWKFGLKEMHIGQNAYWGNSWQNEL